MLGDLHLRAPVSVDPTTSLAEAARMMAASGISSLLVTGVPPGILTERDLARAWATSAGPESPVEEVASPHPLWAVSTTHLLDACGMMLRHQVRHLVVLEPLGTPVGVVSMRDALALVVRSLEPQVVMSALAGALLGEPAPGEVPT